MLRRILTTCAALGMCAATGSAFAVERGFYLGAGLGQSDSGLHNGNINYSDSDLGYKVIAGFRPLKLLAVEVNYVDLGNTNSNGVEAKTRALDGFVMGFLPLPVVDIYGKVGLVNWKTDSSSPSFSVSHNGNDFAYGVGAQLHYGALAARLEFEGFDVQQASTPTLLSLGVTWTFL